MKLTFAGDFSLGDCYLQRLQRRKPGSSAYRRLLEDPMRFVTALRPLFGGDRIGIVNLETVLTRASVSPLEGRKDYLGQDDPGRTIAVLQALGVWGVSLANNHSKDFGDAGLLETMHHLAIGGIRFFGAGDKAGARMPCYVGMAAGRPVYVIASMQYRSRYAREYDYFAHGAQLGVDSFDPNSMARRIRALRQREAKAWIIVFPHWGRNYRMRDDAMRAAAEAWVRAGADLILGHGAHALQECDCVSGVPVCYSLGNVVFNSPGRYRQHGMHPYSAIAQVELETDRLSLRLYPTLTDNRVTDYQVALAQHTQAAECAARVLSADYALQKDAFGWHFAMEQPERTVR
ncbi:CapA family protein [Algiphilus sp. NNCM1]|nr:CapA family protein [Algiphilus acroporae]